MSEPDLLGFPCELPVKVFGRNDGDFEREVLAIVRMHFAGLPDSAVRGQASSGGKFVSLTVTIAAQSRAQVDALYRDLTASASVLMVL